MDGMDGIDRIDRIERIDRIDRIDGREGRDRTDKRDGIDTIDTIDTIDMIDMIDWIGWIDWMNWIESKSNLDETHTYIYSNLPKTYLLCSKYVPECLVFLLILSAIVALHQESILGAHPARICSCSIVL